VSRYADVERLARDVLSTPSPDVD